LVNGKRKSGLQSLTKLYAIARTDFRLLHAVGNPDGDSLETVGKLSPPHPDLTSRRSKIEISLSTVCIMTELANPHPLQIAPVAHHPARNPILLVHGLTDKSHKMRKIASHLRTLGWEVYAIDLTPNNGDAKLEILAQQVADLVSRTFAPDQKIDLIGFSMGGLVSRYYVQRLGGIDRVQRLITISSPHHGTVTAYFSLRPGCVQMRPDSEFIADLDRDVDCLDRLNFTSLWTPFDLMILPPTSSQLSIGTEIVLPVLTHPLMVFDPRCLKAISAALAQPVKSPI
jgi:triacylglycerol lipase